MACEAKVSAAKEENLRRTRSSQGAANEDEKQYIWSTSILTTATVQASGHAELWQSTGPSQHSASVELMEIGLLYISIYRGPY